MIEIHELNERLESAICGGNSGDIVAAAADREAANFRDIVSAAESVVATAFGNTDGLSLEDQLEAIRLSVSVLRDELTGVK